MPRRHLALERLTRQGVAGALRRRGGLRADVVRGGTLRVGDRVEPVPDEDDVRPAPPPEATLARADDDRRAPGDGRQAMYVVPLSGRHDWIHSFSGSSDPRPYCVTPPTFLAEMAPSGPRAKKIIGTTSVSRACTRS